MIVFFEVNKRLRKPKGQSRMDNQEWTIKNGQSRKDNQERTIKKGQSRKDNQERTIKNGQSRQHWKHWTHTTQDEDKQNTIIQHNTRKTKTN